MVGDVRFDALDRVPTLVEFLKYRNIIQIAAVERINRDAIQAVLANYDRIAACDPGSNLDRVDAVGGHDMLQALNGSVEKTYVNRMSSSFNIDQLGLIEMCPVAWIQHRIDDMWQLRLTFSLIRA